MMSRVRPSVRDSLLALADQLPDLPLAVVAAPAGSGRTALLEAWRDRLQRASRATAWLDLSALHDEAGALLSDLVYALGASGLALDPRLERRLAEEGEPDPRECALLLARTLRDRASPRFLFLEDYHLLAPDGAGAQLLEALIDANAPALHVVLSTRGPLPAAAARFRAGDRLLELGAEDLLLHAAEVAVVLTRHGVEADADIVAPLLALTEGWAAGVVLAARLLGRRPPAERAAALRDLRHAPDFFAYFAGEVLAGESPETVAILEAAALVGRARVPELAAAAALPTERVEACVEQGLLQASGEEVTLPGLWRSLLRERLASDPDAQARRLRLERAGNVLLARGRVEEALELAATFHDVEALMLLLESAGRQVLALGRRTAVRTWLDAIPAAMRENRPALLQLEGLAWLDRDPPRAERKLRAAADAFRRRRDYSSERRAVGALMQICLGEGRINEAMALARTQIGMFRLIRDPGARGDLLTALAGRNLLARRFTRSLRLSERAVRHPIAPDSRWLNAMNRVLLHTLRGEHRRAIRIADEALADREVTMHVLPGHALRILRALPRAALGDLETAEREGDHALDALRQIGFRRSFMGGALALAGVHLLAGDSVKARALLSETITLASELGNGAVEAMARGELAFVMAMEGDPATASEALAAHEVFVGASAGRNDAWPWIWARALWALAVSGSAKRAWQEAHAREGDLLQPELPLIHHTAALLLADVARRAGAEADATRLSVLAFSVSAKAGLERPLPELPAETVRAATREAFAAGVATDHVLARLLAGGPRAAGRFLEEAALDGSPMLAQRAVEQMGKLVWDVRDWDAQATRALAAPADDESSDETRRALATLFADYTGSLLPDLPDDLWLDPLRQRLGEHFSAVGRALAHAYIDATQLDAADVVALRLLDADLADEAAWAVRMRIRLDRGERASALRLFATASENLRRELDLEPGEELQALARQAEAG